MAKSKVRARAIGAKPRKVKVHLSSRQRVPRRGKAKKRR